MTKFQTDDQKYWSKFFPKNRSTGVSLLGRCAGEVKTRPRQDSVWFSPWLLYNSILPFVCLLGARCLAGCWLWASAVTVNICSIFTVCFSAIPLNNKWSLVGWLFRRKLDGLNFFFSVGGCHYLVWWRDCHKRIGCSDSNKKLKLWNVYDCFCFKLNWKLQSILKFHRSRAQFISNCHQPLRKKGKNASECLYSKFQPASNPAAHCRSPRRKSRLTVSPSFFSRQNPPELTSVCTICLPLNEGKDIPISCSRSTRSPLQSNIDMAFILGLTTPSTVSRLVGYSPCSGPTCALERPSFA